MSKLGDQFAFPQSQTSVSGLGDFPGAGSACSYGMTYRQWLAGLAMQAYIAVAREGSTAHAIVAFNAVKSADALIHELEKVK